MPVLPIVERKRGSADLAASPSGKSILGSSSPASRAHLPPPAHADPANAILGDELETTFLERSQDPLNSPSPSPAARLRRSRIGQSCAETRPLTPPNHPCSIRVAPAPLGFVLRSASAQGAFGGPGPHRAASVQLSIMITPSPARSHAGTAPRRLRIDCWVSTAAFNTA